MRIRFCGTVPKDEEFCNEDAAYPCEEGHTERVALSDGASESYASSKLAKLIVKNLVLPSGDTDFCDNPLQWVDDIRRSYNDLCGNFNEMSWSKQWSFGRGSFATLLALIFSRETRLVNALWVGDTCAFLLEGGEFRASVPYISSDAFKQCPELISTRQENNAFLSDDDFLQSHSEQWPVTSKTVILCMTDALAAWALRCEEESTPVWDRLCGIDQTGFETLVTDARKSGMMRVDDSTLLVIDFESEPNDGVSDS